MNQKFRKYYYTIKYISASQFAYRFYYTFKRKLYERIGPQVYASYERQFARKKLNINPDPKFIINNRERYFENLPAVLSNKFTFQKRTLEFGKNIDWHPHELNRGTRLWKMNLNYMEYIWDIALKYKKTNDQKYLNYIEETIEEWHRQNPIGTKVYYRDNWNSYSISFRLSMWIKTYTLLKDDFSESFKKLFLKQLSIQAAFLYDNLELDLLGNHVLKNWMALYWSGTFLKEKKYINRADQLFNKYIQYQFTKNNNHEELSPMYAAIILEDLMEVSLFNSDERLKKLIQDQFKNVFQLTKNQEYVFFNDSVNQNGILPQQLSDFFHKLFPKEKEEKDLVISVDGYLGFKNENAMLVFDGGQVIEGNQAAHVHCDALSFEFFIKDQKVFTNSGTFEYDNTRQRYYSRSTAAHNTLQYGEFQQSEIWASFRLARRATIKTQVLENTKDKLYVKSELTGFDFSKTVKHERSIEGDHQEIRITDKIKSSPKDQTLSKIFFHLAPPFSYRLENDSLFIVNYKKKIAAIKVETPFEIIETEFYPTFGITIKKQTLVLKDIPPEKEIQTAINFFEEDRLKKTLISSEGIFNNPN